MSARVVLGCVLATLATSARAEPPLELVPQVSRGAAFGRVAAEGRYAVRWLGGQTLTLWDHESGMLLGELAPPPGTRVDCAISPDGRYLAFDGIHQIVVQDLDTGTTRTIGPVPDELTGVWFSRDGARVFAAHAKDPFGAGHDHAVSAWRFSDGAKLSQLATPVSGPGVSLGPRQLVVGAAADELYWPSHQDIGRYDMATGRRVEDIPIPADLRGAIALVISADGKHAASRHVRTVGAQRDAVLAYWDWPRRAVIQTVPLLAPRAPWISPVEDDLAIAPDGRHVVVRIPGSRAVRLYRFAETTAVRELTGDHDLLAFTADGRRVVIGTGLYSATTGALVVPEIPVLASFDTRVAIHGTDVHVVRGKAVSAWDLQHLTRRWAVLDGVPDGQPRAAASSADGRTLTVTSATRVRTFEAATGAPKDDRPRAVRMRASGLSAAEESPDGRWVIELATGARTAELRARDSGRVVRTYSLAKPPLVGTQVFAWTRHGFASATGDTLQLWTVTSDRPVATHAIDPLPDLAQAGMRLAVSPDGNTLAVARADRAVRVFDAATGAAVRAMDVRSLGFVWELAIADDRTHAVIVVDGTPVALDLTRGAALRLIEHADQWVIADDRGVFTASAGAGRLLAAVRGRRGFRIEQLALRNNDPAALMRAFGVGSDEQRAYFEHAYRARLRRAGVAATAIGDLFADIPEVRFGRVTQDGARATLELELAAPRGLRRYHVDVDGVPVFGAGGKPVTGTHQRVTETIELGRGTNRIELRVVDAAGVEGLRPIRLLEAPDRDRRPELYFLGFGVSEYANPAYRLAFARKDVLDVAAALQVARSEFGAVRTQVYVDAAVTPARVREAKQFLLRAGVDDLVVVMIAGHGIHATDAAAQYYFVAHATELDHLATTAVPFDAIEDLVDGLTSRRKLFLVDTCESGEREPGEEAAAIARAGSRGLAARALVRVARARPAAPRRFVLERDNFLFNGILRSSGTVVFSSSRGSELSYETAELGNGVFTQAVLEALTGPEADTDRDGRIAIGELRAHVARRVADYTGGAQNPTIDRDNLAAELALPVLAAARPIVDRSAAPLADYAVDRVVAPAPPASPPRVRAARGCGCGTGLDPGVVLGIAGLAFARRRRR